MSDTEIEFLTRLAGSLIDKTLGTDSDADKVFQVVAGAVNRILKLAQSQGLDCKFEVIELCTRAWLIWHSYQSEKNPALLASLQDVGMKLLGIAGVAPAT